MVANSIWDIASRYASRLEAFPEKDGTKAIRELHAELTASIGQSQRKGEFAIALLYKNYIEDLLRNSIENNYVANEPVINAVRSLGSSMRSFAKDKYKGITRGKWLDKLFDDFGGYLQDISRSRKRGNEIIVEGPGERRAKLFVAPIEGERIFFGDQWEEVFPNLDDNLSDYEFSEPICNWYLDIIGKLKEEKKVNALCFIEKPYSCVGGLSLMPLLVTKLELPATLYRASYWDKEPRIAGTRPSWESQFCFVYDIVVGGATLSEANSFLKENYGAKANSAVVFFDFEKNGTERLRSEGIEVFSYLKRSDVEKQIEAKKTFMKMMRPLEDSVATRSYKENHRELRKTLQRYSDYCKQADYQKI